MLKNLRMLLKFRSWWRSWQLKGGGLITGLGALQMWLGSDDGRGILEMLATLLNLMATTVSGGVTSLIGLLLIVLRAKTEWSLAEKVANVDKDPAKVAAVREATEV
jgi:hypothetical protein